MKHEIKIQSNFKKQTLNIYAVYVKNFGWFLGVNDYDDLLPYHLLRRELNKNLGAY